MQMYILSVAWQKKRAISCTLHRFSMSAKRLRLLSSAANNTDHSSLEYQQPPGLLLTPLSLSDPPLCSGDRGAASNQGQRSGRDYWQEEKMWLARSGAHQIRPHDQRLHSVSGAKLCVAGGLWANHTVPLWQV